MLKILPLLFLAGCATNTSLDDMLQEAVACSNAKVNIDENINCDDLWETINRKEEARERRRLRNSIKCPDNYILYKDWSGETCIHRDAFRGIFGVW